MNNRKSSAILLGALTAAIVFLNYYLVIHRIHFWGLFYEFSSNINNPRAVLSSAVLIGGLTYIVMAFLRLYYTGLFLNITLWGLFFLLSLW